MERRASTRGAHRLARSGPWGMAVPVAAALVGTTALLVLAGGCAPRALRGGEGTDNPGLDRPALSTSLDRADIEHLVRRNVETLLASPFWNREVAPATTPPVFAIWPIENRTTQHIGDQMWTLLSSLETRLVNSGEVQVVARSRQEALAEEIGLQQGALFDPSRARTVGRQLGAEYFLTGRITSVEERLGNTRRVQYSLFVQIIEIETGLVKFQHESERSKALKG